MTMGDLQQGHLKTDLFRAGVFSIEVNGNWRLTFEIEDDGAVLLDYRDYHGKQIKAKK